MNLHRKAMVTLGLALGCCAWGAPVLELEPSVFDWGRQAESGAEYAFRFTVRNAGDEELQITRVRSGCSCTKAALQKQALAPGESTELTGTFSTKGMEGVMQKAIMLTTNDPLRPNVPATLAIRLPFKARGARLQNNSNAVFWREGALWSYVVVENCEPDTPVLIEAMELPPAWDCQERLPITVAPEDRALVALTRKAPQREEVQAFDGLPFLLLTDSVLSPRLQGTLSYQPAAPPAPTGAPPAPPPADPADAVPSPPAAAAGAAAVP